jgi:hypothetical protein
VVYAQLTEIYVGLGRDLQGLISEAQYHRLTGNNNRAINLYDEILALKQLDTTTVSRIEEKRAEIIADQNSSSLILN